MTVRAQEQKNAHIEAVVALCATSSGGAPRDRAFGRFVRQFYAHVPPEDVLGRSKEDLLGAALSLWRFAAERRPGEAKVRVVNPEAWRSAGRTVVEIANDDMPFLVDSVTAALNGAGCVVNLVIHPVVLVARGAEFRLKDVLEPDEGNGGAALRESFMHVEIGEERDPEKLAALARRVEGALLDVRRAVTDWQPMRSALARVLDDLASRPPPLPQKELTEGLAFLRWLDEDNFTFLGYREYRFDGGAVSGDGAGLGILRDENYSVFDGLRRFAELPPEVQDFLRQPKLLMIAKSNKRATVHRAAHMDAIGVKIFAADGRVTGERLFLGLFTSLAYSRSARAIPLLRQKVQKVIARAGFPPTSHDGKALLHILDNFPRDELFQLGEDELFDVVTGILNLQERQRIALFVRRDPFERFVSCFVFVPRERYNTELRVRMARILEEAYAGEIAGFQTQLDESVLARIHFIVRTTRGRVPDIDAAEVERRLVEAGRTWADRLSEALAAAKGAETGRALLTRYAAAFPTAYRETRDADAAIEDIDLVEHVLGGAPLGLRLHRPEGAGERGLAFTLIREGSPIALSDVLPMLENMGLRVISETPHEVAIAGRPVFLHDFTLETRAASAADAASARARFEEAFAKVWSGELESDGFNRLVLLAGLSWRQVVVLRTYCKVLRQAGAAFSQAYMEDALAAHGPIAAALVRLFETRFDPAFKGERDLKANGIVQEIDHALDAVTNLDEDRILRSYLQLIQKTLRTNHYQTDAQGGPKPYLSVKLASSEIDLLPLPRPLFEVYVYSPRTEGVHLRGGKVARGGIRWSDRKEDFRTEILGLMKAQMVKNAVIVPVGSKGGFVVKHPPAGREAYQAEGVECYKTLMRGLLDVTDNIVGEQIVPPVDVVRRDPDDPYLVVAADKGTATFSDIANGVARDYGFWLDDAFASGGSAGYDHKTMGITARGAWETVKRHFRELGTDIQTTPFTCVGVGDMSGDVFGNGMLLSPATKLVGAFNHLHIFVDPEPDPAASLAERKRLFEKPRSAWSDYDVKLISKGGGIFERSAKSIALSPEMKTLFGIEAERVTPAELIRAMLKAQVDLLWFGGIGTYVKASAESQADAGDRANDVLRIDGRDIRARVVGEGANLGVTQRGRIEYALGGGRINTDAIDNSAGVDTSDHEVNLKILLNPVLGREEKRNQLLAEMTDDVAELVLRDNYLQSLAISLAELHGAELLDRHARLIRTLEREGKLDRALEFLPDDETLAARAHARHGLTRPELAVLLAYAKNVLYAELLPSDLPDDPQLVGDLVRYFPKRLSKPYREAMLAHRLRREIIATFVTNSIVNRAGIAFVGELKERTGRPASDIARAYAVTRDAFELRPLWSQVDALDNKVATAIQYDMVWAAQLLAERATLWLLGSGLALDVQARLNQFRPGIAKLRDVLTQILPEDDRAALEKRIAVLTDAGVPGALAERVAKLDWLVPAFDIVRLDETSPLDIVEVGRIYFAVGARFGFDRLRALAQRLDATTAWQKMAVAALLDDLFALQSVLAGQALAAGGVAKWEQQHRAALAPLEGVLAEMLAATTPDLAMLTVASRQLRSLAGQN